jgi:serine/threonine protein kinase
MLATTTNGNARAKLAKTGAFSMEMRSEVEKAFQRQVPDEHGLAAREKFCQMLEALGLTKDEAVLLLDECDPSWQKRLPYRDFLDFIFGPNLSETKDEIIPQEPKYPTSDGGVIDKLAQDQNTEKAAANGVGDANSQRDAEVTGETKTKEVEEVKKTEPSKPEPEPAVEVEVRMESKESKVASEALEKPLDGTVTPDASDKESVATIISNVKTGSRKCHMCTDLHDEVFEDPNDNYTYCERCWLNWYGFSPNKVGPALVIPKKLVNVVQGKLWAEDKLLMAWAEHPIHGWPPSQAPTRPVTSAEDPTGVGEFWAPVQVKLNPGLVGSHARTCTQSSNRELVGEVLCNRYTVQEVVGAGHFTRALLAIDSQTGGRVCVKKHNNITVELLTDLLTIGRRLQHVDKDGVYFPQLFEAFFDIDGYTVESLITGKNCLLVGRSDPEHFRSFDNLRIVAKGGLNGLVHMARACVVHCDLKPDNIMWVAKTETREATVQLVDFGCSRLDSRIESGRNWSLAEGGAGHVGKWAPEMVLRLPITHKADVWGLAVSLLELHCGRATWSGESDTVEVILAQVLGIVNARNGLPVDLLKRSPLDIRQLYTPHPCYFPVQRYGTFGRGASFQELRPAAWGLGFVLGNEDTWDEIRKTFATFITTSMTLDHEKRPSAEQMLAHPFIGESADAEKKFVEEQA